MKIHLPNSAHLQNIEGFVKRFSPDDESRLCVSGHDRYIHVHPFAMAMCACLGSYAKTRGAAVEGSLPKVKSLPYLQRMKLFEHLDLPLTSSIQEHAETGRFIPLTVINTSESLKSTITELIPLLHAPAGVADPIRYVFSELGRNTLEHSASEIGAFVCAQYFKDKKRIAIGIADHGQGIFNALNVYHGPETEAEAFKLAMTPGISGQTPMLGGNATNAGAGLFFIRSIAKVTGNFFAIYSGNTLFKLRRSQASADVLYANPYKDNHSLVTGLPYWQGTVIGIDINVDETAEFTALLNLIRKSYTVGTSAKKVDYTSRIDFT